MGVWCFDRFERKLKKNIPQTKTRQKKNQTHITKNVKWPEVHVPRNKSQWSTKSLTRWTNRGSMLWFFRTTHRVAHKMKKKNTKIKSKDVKIDARVSNLKELISIHQLPHVNLYALYCYVNLKFKTRDVD